MTGVPAPTLRRRWVVLRPVQPDDVNALRTFLCDPSVARWWGQPRPMSMWSTTGSTPTRRRPSGRSRSTDYRHASIDLFLGPAFQGRGPGSDAIRTLARWLVEDRGHHRLTIDPSAANERAIRTYTAIGFRPAGVMRRYERGPDGTFHDGLLMDLLRDEFRP